MLPDDQNEICAGAVLREPARVGRNRKLIEIGSVSRMVGRAVADLGFYGGGGYKNHFLEGKSWRAKKKDHQNYLK